MFHGQCDGTTTSTLATVHNFFASSLGLLVIGLLGAAGLLTAYVARKDVGRAGALAAVGAAVVLGFLLTLGSARLSTAMQCGGVRASYSSSLLSRSGFPAYFEADEPDSEGQAQFRLQFGVDALFWAGMTGLIFAGISMRRSRRSLASDMTAPRTTATFARRSR